MMTLGRCLCGAIEFEVSGEPTRGSWCHCSQCRRAHGATPVAWVSFPRSGFRLRRGTPRWYASSESARRGFCESCGSPMLIDDAIDPDGIDIATAILDAAADLGPVRHIWVGSALPWAAPSDPAIPTFQERSTPRPDG